MPLPGVPGWIRRVRRTDVGAIIALDTLTTGISKDAHWRELVARGCRKRRENEFVFLVAVSDDDSTPPSGFIVGEVRAWEFGSAPCGWVYAMAVDPSVREQRVGEHLLAAVATEFGARASGRCARWWPRRTGCPCCFSAARG
ncbi:MAG: GNAT family N-acetyltransferase [Steroidobacteraceae bacterium]